MGNHSTSIKEHPLQTELVRSIVRTAANESTKPAYQRARFRLMPMRRIVAGLPTKLEPLSCAFSQSEQERFFCAWLDPFDGTWV
jgi:hypothetical protein